MYAQRLLLPYAIFMTVQPCLKGGDGISEGNRSEPTENFSIPGNHPWTETARHGFGRRSNSLYPWRTHYQQPAIVHEIFYRCRKRSVWGLMTATNRAWDKAGNLVRDKGWRRKVAPAQSRACRHKHHSRLPPDQGFSLQRASQKEDTKRWRRLAAHWAAVVTQGNIHHKTRYRARACMRIVASIHGRTRPHAASEGNRRKTRRQG